MSFENLDVWKRASRLSATLYTETKNLKDSGFRDQLTRSGLSTPTNIAEGFEHDSSAEIARFLTIAKGSAGECITQIYIGIEACYLDKTFGMTCITELKEISAILSALIKRTKSSL